jgi:hypothetical protein
MTTKSVHALRDGSENRPGVQRKIDWTQPRPAEMVMQPDRLAAACPNALSFSRTLFNRLYESRWVLTRVRLDIDRDGRGEVLYRMSDGRHTLHFMVISNCYSSETKADRSYNMNWDATAALCEGEWTEEREEFLRREIPKQRFGRLDHQTLAYTRGNRSGRIFDYVVDCLAEGRQPDGAQLAPIGYIFRTTGFTANGFIGMRSYLGMELDHPLRGPYHAQMCSAFLLREYVSDLVDAMAAARNPGAARLSAPLRRYLGIGNSAGLGLTPFICNHPRLLHLWTWSKEVALAQARSREVRADDPEVQEFRHLLAKAKRYFTEDARDGNGIFASNTLVADQIGQAIRWSEVTLLPRLADTPRRPWIELLDWAESTLHYETIEVLHAVLIELYPDIVHANSRQMTGDETLDIDASMSVADLRSLISDKYGWTEECFGDVEQSTENFWYMSSEAPYEPRRGRRGFRPEYEFEMHMDAPLQLARLRHALADVAADVSLAEFVAIRPEFRNIAAWLCSLADGQYGLLRENTLADGHMTFGSVRFMLSHYGMDKLDAQKPRSVKGVLLQGAPIGVDLPMRRGGDWPFVVVPQDHASSAPPAQHREEEQKGAKELIKLEVWRETEFGERITVAPVELLRWGQRALQARGCSLGLAVTGAQLMHARQLLEGDGLSLALAACERRMLSSPADHRITAGNRHRRVKFSDRSIFVAGPTLLDLACFDAARGTGVGVAIASDLVDLPLAGALPAWAGSRGFDCIVVWRDGSGSTDWTVVASGKGREGRWLATRRCDGAAKLDHLLGGSGHPVFAEAISETAEKTNDCHESICCVICFARSGGSDPVDIQALIPAAGPGDADILIDAAMAAKYRYGVVVDFAQLEKIKDLAFETLLPVELEEPVLLANT